MDSALRDIITEANLESAMDEWLDERVMDD